MYHVNKSAPACVHAKLMPAVEPKWPAGGLSQGCRPWSRGDPTWLAIFLHFIWPNLISISCHRFPFRTEPLQFYRIICTMCWCPFRIIFMRATFAFLFDFCAGCLWIFCEFFWAKVHFFLSEGSQEVGAKVPRSPKPKGGLTRPHKILHTQDVQRPKVSTIKFTDNSLAQSFLAG